VGHDRGDTFSASLESLVGTAMVTGAFAEFILTGAGLAGVGRPFAFGADVSVAGGVVASPSSSGIGGQYVLRTCLSAGRRMGLDKKKSMPDSRHS
jgi:hypothetical protein